jgi:hypothetical protein
VDFFDRLQNTAAWVEHAPLDTKTLRILVSDPYQWHDRQRELRASDRDSLAELGSHIPDLSACLAAIKRLDRFDTEVFLLSEFLPTEFHERTPAEYRMAMQPELAESVSLADAVESACQGLQLRHTFKLYSKEHYRNLAPSDRQRYHMQFANRVAREWISAFSNSGEARFLNRWAR